MEHNYKKKIEDICVKHHVWWVDDSDNTSWYVGNNRDFMEAMLKLHTDDWASLLTEIEGKRIEPRLEELDSEEKDLLIEIFGEAKTPEYLVERRTGYNQAIQDCLSLIRSKLE